MVIHWVYFFTGLVFGLIPPRYLLNSDCRYLTFESLWTRVLRREKDSQKRRRWWKLPLVWIDPVRGYVAATMVNRAFEAVPKATFIQAQYPVLALLVVVMAVLLVQTRGRPHEPESLSPAGFMAGMMLALLPPTVAIGAMVVGGATAIALQGYSAGYLAAMLLTAGIGFVFMGKSPKLGVLVLMVGAPAWMSWLRGTTLVTPVRC